MEPTKEYSKVALSLDNCIVPRERLLKTPSRQDGVSCELEVKLRLVGCECIQTAGLLLKLPQVAMATAQVLFQRFYYSKSFIKYSLQPMAMACIFVAAKIEEDCRRIRDVINVFHHLRQKRLGKQVSCMDYMGEEYFKLKSTVIKYERFLLKELGFCVHVKHSHKLIITYLQMLEMDKHTSLAQRSWNFINDSLRTNVFVRFSPETIACACIYLGARQLKIPLPQSPPWWLMFDADYEDMEAIALELLALYHCPRVQLEEVEREIGRLKEEYQKRQIAIKEVRLKKTIENLELQVAAAKKGLLPTPGSLQQSDNSQSSQESPSPNTSLTKSTFPLTPPTQPRPRSIPKSYKVTTPPPSPPRPGRDLRIPAPRPAQSVSPLVTHVHSAREQTPPPKSAPSPIRWQEGAEEGADSTDESSESRTPSPVQQRSHTPRAYRPVMSPIVLSEGASDSPAGGTPSPLSLVRRENGLQEREDEMYDRKVRRNRHRRGDRGDHRGHREMKRVRSHSNEEGDRYRGHTHHRHSKHRHKERRERHEYPHERRHRERGREYPYDQRSRNVDRIRR